MKIFAVLLLSLTRAKVPHDKSDLDKLSEDDRKDFDRDIVFDDQEEWDPWELHDDDIKERLKKIFIRIDHNGDGFINKEELTTHTYESLYRMDEKEAEEEFIDADEDQSDSLSWDEYVMEFYGLDSDQSDEKHILDMDTDTGVEFNHMYARDKGRFHAADFDSDGKLTLIEFVSFKNPLKSKELKETAIEWAIRDVDKNGDGKISKEEYLNDFLILPEDKNSLPEHYGAEYMEEEEKKFEEDFDLDGNGFIEGEELNYWLGPDNTEIAIEEAEHLIDMCDANSDNRLTVDELLENHDIWVDSDATEYGQQLQFVHDEL